MVVVPLESYTFTFEVASSITALINVKMVQIVEKDARTFGPSTFEEEDKSPREGGYPYTFCSRGFRESVMAIYRPGKEGLTRHLNTNLIGRSY